MAPYVNHFTFLQTISLVCFLATLTCTVSSLISLDEECSALFQFKQSIIHQHDDADCGGSWFQTFHSWKPTSNTSDTGFDCCSWHGVECNKYGQVIGLDLSENSLCGQINSTSPLFSLVHLQSLNLAMNYFDGSQIPSQIGYLKQLKSLNLSDSGLSGQIPNEISQLKQLSSLDLSRNSLKLHSPSFKNLVQNLTGLEVLHISGVDISSSIPHFLANFSSLSSIRLSNCSLQNELPVAILDLPKLKYLSLGSNPILTGSFHEFRNNSLLEILNLALTVFFGIVPESISNLNHLSLLHLSGCSFSGRIPASLSNLTQLTWLGLGSNKFTGFVPSLARLSKLNILQLNGNKFENRRLPNWLGKLTELTNLYAYEMNIDGEIPSFLANLTKLSIVNMRENSLSGHIPSSFFNLTQLTMLDLRLNQLQGPISSLFSNFKSLQYIVFNSNNFSGRVELDMFLRLNKLQTLSLGNNKISLVVNNNYTNTTLPELEFLDLQLCNLKEFPAFLRFQNKLRVLFIERNEIDGMVPVWIWNNSKETLELINLSGNSITGFDHNPHFLPWRRLESFYITHNQVQGQLPIPPQTIVSYDFSFNNLTGEIPPLICEAKFLQELDLSSNNMSGPLPPCFGSLSNSLMVLILRQNNFHGTMMNAFKYGSLLESIDLSENRFTGTLPKLQVLILRSNKLNGPIQSSTIVRSQFHKLRIIDLSNNSFSGELNQKYFQTWNAMHSIPVGVSPVMKSKIYSKMVDSSSPYSMTLIHKGVRTEYEEILTIDMADLSCNHFEGEIPLSLQDLRGLQSLNLSNNHFTGHALPWLGYLTNLESLDISQNDLSGELPQQLVQLGFLSILNVSFNHLDGRIPQGKQFDTFDNNSYMGNPGLCGKPLSKECKDSKGSRLPQESNMSESLLTSERIDWIIIFCGVGSGLVIGIFFGNFLHTNYSDRFTKRKDKWIRPLRNKRKN